MTLLAALVAGAISGYVALARVPHIANGHTQRVRCTVLGELQVQVGSSSFLCALDGGPNVRVSLSGPPPAIAAHLLLRGRLEEFDEPRNPGEPSQRLLERDRGAAAHLANARVLAVLPAGRITLAIAIARFHDWGAATLRGRLDEPAASILAGELWGDRGSLPPDLRAEFQETGTVHILVTAGLHLGVAAALMLALLAALNVPRTWACAIAIAFVWLYATVSGMHLPAMRAATMLSFALLARACGAKTLSFNAIAAAALVVGLFDPLAVPGASFALSFSCVVAIAAWAEPLEELLDAHAAFPVRIREAVVLTVATQLGTWPLTASVFGMFSPYAVIAN
ncbi:MAG: ComEC/Rec2 family competence protein, partial [Rhodanobacteraceae bacterium]